MEVSRRFRNLLGSDLYWVFKEKKNQKKNQLLLMFKRKSFGVISISELFFFFSFVFIFRCGQALFVSFVSNTVPICKFKPFL